VIDRIDHKAPSDASERILLVMLPGVGIAAADFASERMVVAVHARVPDVDIIATRPDLDLYLDGAIAAALHDEIIAPAQAQGYARIWLLGISLGGMGALLYAAQFPGVVEGVVLLAPFLGTQGTVAELVRARHLAAWSAAGSAATALELLVLTWLQQYTAHRPPRPALYLGFGRTDRFADGHRLLADSLAPDQVFEQPGGHDWDTWRGLWSQILDTAPFARHSDHGYHHALPEGSGNHDG
jgi:pimeloyl-ACP methyl ester carboxylesterase